jgi:hypothetical protein
MAIHLVPLHVFKAEITRLNELYWTSKYSYSRVSELLKTLNKSYEEPRVNHLLPSDDAGETTHIIRPLSEFLVQLKNNESDLRTTAILHMCSAFETPFLIILHCVLFTSLTVLIKNIKGNTYQTFLRSQITTKN